jgi:hypothetical protein
MYDRQPSHKTCVCIRLSTYSLTLNGDERRCAVPSPTVKEEQLQYFVIV